LKFGASRSPLAGSFGTSAGFHATGQPARSSSCAFAAPCGHTAGCTFGLCDESDRCSFNAASLTTVDGCGFNSRSAVNWMKVLIQQRTASSSCLHRHPATNTSCQDPD